MKLWNVTTGANERALTRWFEHVHGLCVMLPAQHLEPGLVVARMVELDRRRGRNRIAFDDSAT